MNLGVRSQFSPQQLPFPDSPVVISVPLTELWPISDVHHLKTRPINHVHNSPHSCSCSIHWAEASEELQSPRKPHSLRRGGIYVPGGQDAPRSPSGNLQWTASDEAMGYLLQQSAFPD